MGRTVVAIANPAAGRSGAADAGPRTVRAFQRAEPRSRVELLRTEGPGHARRLAARAAEEGVDLVLAVGGDGTAHEVANGLLGTATLLGIVPAGTMNLLARVLGIPVDLRAAAARIAVSRSHRAVRPGLTGDRVFLLMAGIGFDAWVLQTLLERTRGKIRFRDYVRGAARGLWSYPFPEIEVRTAAETIRGHSVVVGRSPLYGGFLRPTPRADLAAARLDVCVLSGGPGGILRALSAMWSGTHLRQSGVRGVLADSLEIDARGLRVPIQLDGEAYGELPARFGISERTIRLVV